jgi:DnaJ domain
VICPIVHVARLEVREEALNIMKISDPLISLVVAFFFFVLVEEALADKLRIYGVEFPLEEGVDVGGGLVELSLPGGKKLVSSESVEEAVVEAYLGREGSPIPSGARQFTPKDLATIAQNAAKERNVTAVGRALLIIIELLPAGSHQFQELVDFISQTSLDSSTVFAPILLQKQIWEKFPAVAVHILRQTTILSQPRLIEQIAPSLSHMSHALQIEFEVAIFMEVLVKDFEAAQALLELLDAGEVQDSQREMLRKIVKSTHDADSGENILVTVIQEAQKDAGIWKRIRLKVAEGLPEAVSNLVQEGSLREAFELVAVSQFQDRTPKSHDAVNNALNAAIHNAKDFQLTPQLSVLLKKFSEIDQKIRHAYVDVLKNKIILLVEQREPVQLEVYWRYLLEVNPDPSSINDDLRYYIAQSFIKDPLAGTEAFLTDSLKSLSLRQKLSLRLLKLYQEFPFLETVGILLFIIIISFILYRRWQSSLWRSRGEASTRTTQVIDNPFEQEQSRRTVSRFAGASSMKIQDPRVQEYDECLGILGLKRGASVKEIKATYRTLVKTQHPDLAGGRASKNSTEGFMKLKDAYDRLLELESDATFTAVKNGLVQSV